MAGIYSDCSTREINRTAVRDSRKQCKDRADWLLQYDDAVGWRHSHKAALWLAVVGKVRRPLPVIEQIQQLPASTHTPAANYTQTTVPYLPAVLWHCWLGVRKSIRPVKNWVMRCWCGYLSGARCILFEYGLLADATASRNPIISNVLQNAIISCLI